MGLMKRSPFLLGGLFLVACATDPPASPALSAPVVDPAPPAPSIDPRNTQPDVALKPEPIVDAAGEKTPKAGGDTLGKVAKAACAEAAKEAAAAKVSQQRTRAPLQKVDIYLRGAKKKRTVDAHGAAKAMAEKAAEFATEARRHGDRASAHLVTARGALAACRLALERLPAGSPAHQEVTTMETATEASLQSLGGAIKRTMVEVRAARDRAGASLKAIGAVESDWRQGKSGAPPRRATRRPE